MSVTNIYPKDDKHEPTKEAPYAGDQLARQELGKRIKELIGRLPGGAVLSIDAPWGQGKTWFAKCLRADLDNSGFTTVYIDCFQRDYLDDPFSVVAGALIELAASKSGPIKGALLESGKKLGAALLPAATKALVNAAGHLLIGNAGLAGDIADKLAELEEHGADQLEKLVEERLKKYREDEKTLETFRTKLAELSATEEKPIVIFIDELDRCRPDFAIAMLERIKHFFDVPNIVFVLLINRHALVSAIRGRYGERFAASEYLEKFIHLQLSLPRHGNNSLKNSLGYFIRQKLARSDLQGQQATEDFAAAMGEFGAALGLSLRSMERASIMFLMAQPIGDSAAYLAWPIALKLAAQDVFTLTAKNEKSGHDAALKLLIQCGASKHTGMHVIEFWMHVHKTLSDHNYNPEQRPSLPNIFVRLGGSNEVIDFFFNRIDISVEAGA